MTRGSPRPEHPGLKSETWATHLIFVGVFVGAIFTFRGHRSRQLPDAYSHGEFVVP
jgi:hypothetical protein